MWWKKVTRTSTTRMMSVVMEIPALSRFLKKGKLVTLNNFTRRFNLRLWNAAYIKESSSNWRINHKSYKRWAGDAVGRWRNETCQKSKLYSFLSISQNFKKVCKSTRVFKTQTLRRFLIFNPLAFWHKESHCASNADSCIFCDQTDTSTRLPEQPTMKVQQWNSKYRNKIKEKLTRNVFDLKKIPITYCWRKFQSSLMEIPARFNWWQYRSAMNEENPN